MSGSYDKLNAIRINTASNIFLCKVYKNEMEDILDEVIEGHKDHIDEIIRLVFNKPCNYLFINQTPKDYLKNLMILFFLVVYKWMLLCVTMKKNKKETRRRET